MQEYSPESIFLHPDVDDCSGEGNSLDRQREQSAKFAALHDLDLEESLSGRDIGGISAFKGRNAVHGNLKKILDAIEDGRIARGIVAARRIA